MNKLSKTLLLTSACLGLAACQTTNVSSPTSLNLFESEFSSAKISKKDGSFEYDPTTKKASVKFDTFEFSGLVESSPGVYTGSSGAAQIRVNSVNVGTDAGLWSVAISDYNGTHTSAFAYVVSGSPTGDLPTASGEYIGSFNAMFQDKGGDVAGKNNKTRGSLKLDVNFGAGTFNGKTTSHSDINSASVAGFVEITNGKISDGKATYDVATKGGLISNLGLDGGAVSGKGDALFYKDSNTNFDKANDMIGTGNFENLNTVGAFGISSGYHPEGTF